MRVGKCEVEVIWHFQAVCLKVNDWYSTRLKVERRLSPFATFDSPRSAHKARQNVRNDHQRLVLDL